MATTITITDKTRRRLADYKRGDDTYDDVLNKIMDMVPIEDIAIETIAEHYHRLQTLQPVSAATIRRRIMKRLREKQ